MTVVGAFEPLDRIWGSTQGGDSRAGLGQMQRETSSQLSAGHLSGKDSWIGHLRFGHLRGSGIFSDFGGGPGEWHYVGE